MVGKLSIFPFPSHAADVTLMELPRLVIANARRVVKSSRRRRVDMSAAERCSSMKSIISSRFGARNNFQRGKSSRSGFIALKNAFHRILMSFPPSECP
jgi:hypothetical protein